MHQIKNNIYFIKLFLKISLSVICYLAFTIYTVPMYKEIRTYVDEKINSNKKTLVIGSTHINVAIMNTPEKRTQGLSGKSHLDQDEGMFFMFDDIDSHNFWMKDMNFSIDIIWFNEYSEVIYIVESLGPETYPATFAPSTKSKYVLEVPAGFVKREGIKLGDKFDLY